MACSDGSYYTGYTNNIRRRINQHNGVGLYFWQGGKYTSKRRPVFLQHLERFPSKKDALKREKEIKAMGTNKRHELVESTTKEQILSAI